jgi:DNA-binding transcriptional MocR family regulator
MLCLQLHKEQKRSYTKQIYRQLRQKILEGELKSGDRLPSTREMSEELKVARNTVLTAYTAGFGGLRAESARLRPLRQRRRPKG